MTATVAEVFRAFQKADRKSLQAVSAGRFDGEAALAIARFAPLLWRCDTPLELNEEQLRFLELYRQEVPK